MSLIGPRIGDQGRAEPSRLATLEPSRAEPECLNRKCTRVVVHVGGLSPEDPTGGFDRGLNAGREVEARSAISQPGEAPRA